MKQQVNFLPLIARRSQPLEATRIGIAVAGVVVLLLLVSAWDFYRTEQLQMSVEDLGNRQAAANETVMRLSTELGEARAAAEADPTIARLRAELDRRRATLAVLDRSDPDRRGFSPHLEGLARRTGEAVWLDRISVQEGGDRLFLRGYAMTAERIPEFIAALRSEAIYDGRRFRRLAIDRSETGGVRFELATLQEPEAADEEARTGARRSERSSAAARLPEALP